MGRFSNAASILAIGATLLLAQTAFLTDALAESPRERISAPCAEGYKKIDHLTIAKEETYECRQVLSCQSGYTAKMYQVVEEDGKIVQHYTCSRPNKGLILDVDAAKDAIREEVTEGLIGTEDD